MRLFQRALIGVIAWFAFAAPIALREQALIQEQTGPLVIALLAVSIAPIFLRYKHPTLALALALFISLSLQAFGSVGPSVAILVALTIFEFNQRNSIKVAIVATLSSAVMVATFSVFVEQAPESIWLAHAAFIGLAGAVGRAIRVQRKLVDETMQRAINAEKSRDALAAEAVAKERLDIARELHDSIGHRLSVINLQSQSIEISDANLTNETRESLKAISVSSREALTEIADFLDSLRTESGKLPKVAEIDELILQFQNRGMKISSESIDLSNLMNSERKDALVKSLREGLNNAEKYGTGFAEITFSRGSKKILMTITNKIKDDQTKSEGGLGILGIRERLESLGGAVHAHNNGDLFTLVVEIPQVEE